MLYDMFILFTGPINNSFTHILNTRMHSSRMRTAHSSTVLGGSPWQRPPWTETPLDRDPPPRVNRITDRCKNITFPQLHLQAVINLIVLCWLLGLFTLSVGNRRFLMSVLGLSHSHLSHGQTQSQPQWFFCQLPIIKRKAKPHIY